MPGERDLIRRQEWAELGEPGSTSPERAVGGNQRFCKCRRQPVLGITALGSE